MRRLIVTALTALATLVAHVASWDAVQAVAGAHPLDPAAAFLVTSVSPSRNQETLPDLSDPGLNTRILVRFSTYPRVRDLLDETNLVNGLSRKVSFLDQAFSPVHASAHVISNRLIVDPFDEQHHLLPIGRYSLTLKPSVRSIRGRRLNEGRAGFTTRFSVGSFRLPLVLVGVSPGEGERDVGLRSTVVASFDVPLDLMSAKSSVRLEDRSTTPPTPIDALVTLERGGLDVVVVPGTPGLPPGADIALVISGRGASTDPTVLTSADGVEFTRDWGPRWFADVETPGLFRSVLGDFYEVTGEFTATFRTKDATAK